MKNIVLVKSRTVNNCSKPIVFKTWVKEYPDGTKDVRELCRSYVFKNYEAQMPLDMAKKLLEQDPKEFFIDGMLGETDEEVVGEIEKANEASKGFINPINGFEAKNKAGLVAHIRINFPGEWEAAGKDLDKFLEINTKR